MHLEQIAQARRLGRKVRNARIVATISGWTTAVFASLTVITSVMHLPGLMLGMGMAIVSIIEFKGAAGLRILDRGAPRRLVINQACLGALLFSYSAWCLWTSLTRPSEILSDPQLAAMIGDVRQIETVVYTAVYGAMMLFAIVGPGLTALYYATRTRHIDKYLQQAPTWIIELQRAGMSI